MSVIAYHFTGDTLRDGRPLPAIGEPLTHEGRVVWCDPGGPTPAGLYASRRPFEALRYAPGPLLSRVRCDRIEREEGDKFVCRERTVLVRIDAAPFLRRFAADQALSVAHLWDMPDVVRGYLTTLDERLRDAASAAAWAAARDAARDAAWAAASAEFDRRAVEALDAA